jgi:hypothetical protein
MHAAAAAQLDSITPFTSWLQQNHYGHDASHGAKNLLSSHILQHLSKGISNLNTN